MPLLENAVALLSSRAGWKSPRRGEDGAYRFRLNGGLDFAVFSPDERIAVLRAELVTLPGSGPDGEERLHAAAQFQVGVCRARASIVALEGPGQSLLASVPVSSPTSGDRLVLHRTVDLAAGQEAFETVVKDFLNDLAWWKTACGNADVREDREGWGGDSPFAMPAMFSGSFY